MNGLIILISAVFVAYFVFNIVRDKKAKYVLALIISFLYGAILFFVGMGIDSVLFYILAVIPLIVSVLYIIKKSYTRKN